MKRYAGIIITDNKNCIITHTSWKLDQLYHIQNKISNNVPKSAIFHCSFNCILIYYKLNKLTFIL